MSGVREFLKKKLSKETKVKLHKLDDNRKSIIQRINKNTQDFRSLGKRNNLEKLGVLYETDKSGDHNYLPHYATHFEKYKPAKIKLLEIGVGGYKDPDLGGNSLRMWKHYFPKGEIYSIDIYDKSSLQEDRIKIFQGSQDDKEFLNRVTEETGNFDIIIDDGSHINEHVIETFKNLFPKLNDNGVYVIEDTQTSYWKEFGGDSQDLNNPATIMSFFKSLTDALNNKEFRISDYQQNYYDKKIVSMHFYHNLIFIYKGNNVEESNILVNNQL
jgi:hypothetical protein